MCSGGVAHVLLASAVHGGEVSASHSGCFTPEQTAACAHWVG